MDREMVASRWTAKFLTLHFAGLILIVVAASDNPWLYLGGPTLCAAIVLAFGLRAARQHAIRRVTRAGFVFFVLFASFLAMLMLEGVDQHRACGDKAPGISCSALPPPTIRYFNAKRPEYRPDIPPNP